jgi:hypothetical protein
MKRAPETRLTLTTDERQDIDGVWTVLATTPPASGVAAVPLGYKVIAGDVLAGIDAQSRRHLLIPLLPGEAARTDTRGRAVHLTRVAHGGRHYLSVVCLLSELHRVFTQFCRELAESVENAKSPAREAAETFARWRALFSDAAHHGLLGEEALVGLLGELLTLEDLLQHGAFGRIDYWRGPLNEIHDFRSPTHAIEVKSTLVREGRIVSISSVDQLQEPIGGDLFLRHLRLERDPRGFDLTEIVDRVVNAGGERTALARALLSLGVNVDALDPYRGKRYRVMESRFYDVTSPAFPRVVRASFGKGDIPPGTLRFNYAVDLTNEPPNPLNPENTEVVLDAFASEVADGVDS